MRLRGWSTVAFSIPLLLMGVFAPPVRASGAALPSDFNGDGYADLAVGVPGENNDVGVVQVLYGAGGGLSASGDQVWSQDTPGVKGVGSGPCCSVDDFDPGDRFGTDVASGDFDGDGFSDLAVGAPYDRVDGVATGAVNVLYGSARGLTAAGDQLVSSSTIAGTPARGARFGTQLAAGDFNSDGYEDLAVGMANADETVAKDVFDAGAVAVLNGGPGGLSVADAAVVSQAGPGVPGDPGMNAQFGSSLATGDIDGDGYADLAAGVPGATVSGHEYAGMAIVLYGGNDGLDLGRVDGWSQDSPGILDTAESCFIDNVCYTWDQFGTAVVIGDLDADGYDDLAIGVPRESIATPEEGAVSVLYGTAAGLTSSRNQLWRQDRAGVPGASETDDRFGWILAVGRFDSGGPSDLAIGAPGESVGSVRSAGSVTVLYGAPSGLASMNAQLWTQDSAGLPGSPEPEDSFGWELQAANFGHSGRDDLVVGDPWEDVGATADAGTVTVLYGRTSGLSATAAQVWSQASPGVKGTRERGDRLGGSIAP